MEKGIYNTAKGNTIDMNKLINKNETTIAVGNLKVNARGDKIGHGGKIIKTAEEVMQVRGAPDFVRSTPTPPVVEQPEPQQIVDTKKPKVKPLDEAE